MIEVLLHLQHDLKELNWRSAHWESNGDNNDKRRDYSLGRNDCSHVHQNKRDSDWPLELECNTADIVVHGELRDVVLSVELELGSFDNDDMFVLDEPLLDKVHKLSHYKEKI